MNEKLNPCRECGKRVCGIEYYYGGWDDNQYRVKCATCNHEGPIGKNDEQAVRLWNEANPMPSQLDLAKYEGHTPGPWIAEQGIDDEPERWVVLADGPRQYHIATIENGQPGDTLKTEGITARLIAAAPDLLAEVRENRETIATLRQQVEEMREGMKGMVDDYVNQHGHHDKTMCEEDRGGCPYCEARAILAKHEQASEHGKEEGEDEQQ